MAVGLTDIDARIADAFTQCANTLWEKDSDGDDWTEQQRRAYEVMSQRESGLIDQRPWLFGGVWGSMAAIWGGSLWWILANDFPTSLGIPGLAVLVGGAYGVTKGLGAWLQSKARPGSLMRQSLLADEVRAMVPLLTLTSKEQVYCEALALLTEAESRMDEATVRDILRQLNVLLENSRQLEVQRADLAAAMGQISVADLEAEHAELMRRLEQARDPIARQTLQQSGEMCADRLESARALAPTLERLDAQQEMIQQTFFSVKTALARMKVAPATLVTPDVEQIKSTVAQVNNQTRAVEQAVQEVMALRAA